MGIVPPPPGLLARWVVPEIGGPVGGPLTLVKKKNVYYEGVISMRSYGVIDLRACLVRKLEWNGIRT